ncbi:MAG: hypothetical protein V4648_04940, partial [Bacteroidota bacterium]
MKTNIILLLLLTSFSAYCQDTIITFRGSKLPAKITAINDTTISYTRSDRKNTDTFTISKNEVWEIKYANGTSTDFFTAAEKSRSLEEIKNHVVEMINKYGYEEDSDNQKYLATFESDYLRLAIMKKDKVKSKGFLFDFSNVFQFHPVSERGKDIAYINIYVSFLDNPKTMKWAKQKLIMRVHGHSEAYDIMRS